MDYLLLIILLWFIEIVFVVVYSYSLMIQIHKRSKASRSFDHRMQASGRAITACALIGMSMIRGIEDAAMQIFSGTVLLACFFFGSRLWLQSYKIKTESKDSRYHACDQWVTKIYRRYLEPLGK